MKVNVVTVSSGWILEKIADRLIENNNKLNTKMEMRKCYQPNNKADINYYIDIYNCFWNKSKIKDVGYFTHLDKDSDKSFEDHWKLLDYIVHKNSYYLDRTAKWGYPREKMKVIVPPIDTEQFHLKKITLGIIQRGYYIGKGHQFMLDLPKYINLKNFRFLFIGQGWDQVCSEYNKRKIAFMYTRNEDYNLYRKYYEIIDYLLVPSLWEGGPMCILEALSCGIPIISSKVGFVHDFKIDHVFEPNNYKQLIKILKNIEKEKLERREQLKNINWNNYILELYNIFKEVLN